MQKIAIAVVVAFVAGAALVYWRFPRTVTLPAEVKTEVVTKTVTVTKERIVQPDGTIIERETAKEDASSSTASKTIEKALPGWSLGAAYRPRLERITEHQWDAWEISAGRRLIGPTWVTVEVNPLRKELALGLRYEF